ncbi:hypothetical protein [Rheinheimera sp.]|uniref:hypothetical protein n=1 Tax=Rheinheimera sp. TaxID=1869214 RepID=UPI00307E3836
MNNLTAFLFDAAWMIALCLVWLFAYVYRRDIRSNLITSAVVLMVFIINHFATKELLSGLRYKEQIEIQYHLWAIACIAISGLTLGVHYVMNCRLLWAAKFIACLMLGEAAFNLIMHIDQNWVGLNDLGAANSSWKKDYWWLWSWYSAQSNIDNALMVTALLLPVSYRGKRLGMDAFKNWFKNALNFNARSADSYARIEVVTELACSADAERRAYALELIRSAKELLARQDETSIDHRKAVSALIDAAAYISQADKLPAAICENRA